MKRRKKPVGRSGKSREVRSLSFMIVMAVAALLLSAAGIAAGEEPIINVDPLVQEAMERSPKILAARERYAALKEKIPQAGAFEDPCWVSAWSIFRTTSISTKKT